jgi:3-oxoacyl-[acyl-carrier protein] reductase
MISLTGKTALITGASKGIGADTARCLASYGANVVLVARTESLILELAQEINSKGGKAIGLACDVARYSEVKTAVDTAKNQFGRLDILVNNAGVIDPISHLAESDPEEWGKVVDINLKGVYHGLRAAIPEMEKQGSGVIVNISSGAAVSALEGWSHYCATKAAVLMLTKSVHKEYAGKGIRVVGLSPGTVATEMQVVIKASGINPVSKLEFSDHIPPSWAGEAVAWLCTDAGKEFDGGDCSLRSEEVRRAIGLT